MNILNYLKIIILFFSLLLTNCAGWNKVDKTLLTINGAVMTVDMLQTINIYNREDEGYYEMNPIIDWGVDRMGKSFIPLYFVSSFGVRYLIADSFPKYRSLFLTSTGIVSTALILHNNSIGLELGF